jgi:hypothetical protein
VTGPRSNEPLSVSKTLSPGQSVTYQTGCPASGYAHTYPLTYADAAGAAEGVNVKLSTGKVFSKRC